MSQEQVVLTIRIALAAIVIFSLAFCAYALWRHARTGGPEKKTPVAKPKSG
jgi:cbb3-type cytochrome oxidase subunit 3